MNKNTLTIILELIMRMDKIQITLDDNERIRKVVAQKFEEYERGKK